MPRMPRSPPQNSQSDKQIPSEIEETEHQSGKGSRAKRRPIESSPAPESDLNIIKAEIKNLFDTWKNQQDTVLNRLANDITEIKQQNKDIKKCYLDIEKSVEFINKYFEEINNRITVLEEHLKESKISIKLLEDKLENIQKEKLQTCIEIRNVPENPAETKEDLSNLVQKIYKGVKLEQYYSTPKDVYRVKAKPGTSRPIFVDLPTSLQKSKIINAVKQYNQTHQENKINTTMIGIDNKKSPIYVSEYLTPKTKRLHFLARDVAKMCNYRYCWTTNGRVYLRKAEGAPHILIKNEAQIDNLRKDK